MVVSEFDQMDRTLTLTLTQDVRRPSRSGALQRPPRAKTNILRDAVNDLSLHFLAKFGIAVVKNVERDDVDFICKTIGCRPIADVSAISPDMLGSADLVEEVSISMARAGSSR